MNYKKVFFESGCLSVLVIVALSIIIRIITEQVGWGRFIFALFGLFLMFAGTTVLVAGVIYLKDRTRY